MFSAILYFATYYNRFTVYILYLLYIFTYISLYSIRFFYTFTETCLIVNKVF